MKNILFYARNIITVPTGNVSISYEINENWNNYDKSVAKSHLHNYGKIYLDKYNVPSDDYEYIDEIKENESLAATAIKNLETFGFTIGKEGYDMLSTASKEDITNWYYDTQVKLMELCGANHTYKPFYPNFPDEVMQKSELEMFIEQIAHYAFGYKPNYKNEKEHINSLEKHNLKVLNVINANNEEEINKKASEIFKNLLKTKQNLPINDMKGIIEPYTKKVVDWTKDAGVIENRNLMCILYAIAVEKDKDTSMMPKMVSNDYLRLAKIMSFNKENNSYPTDLMNIDDIKLKSLPRKFRKFIAEGLDNQQNLEEDVARNKNQFKALFNFVHTNEFKNCEFLNEVVRKVRNNEKLNTFYSKTEEAFKEKDFKKVLHLYASRPGEFIKNYNRLLTYNFTSNKDELNEYVSDLAKTSEKVFAKIRPEDLINFIEYMNSRTRDGKMPVHNVKGKLVIGDKEYKPINKDLCENICNLAKAALVKQICNNASYGKIYIDERLNKMVMPKDIKDASLSMYSYTKGSRIKPELTDEGNSKNIRFHIWWTNTEKEKIDIDLSAELIKKTNLNGSEEKAKFYLTDDNKKLEQFDSVSYHGTYNSAGARHSGDITNGGDINGEGVCEYIDLNINELKENNIDYVKFFINSYSGVPFNELPNCEFGWQEREELDKSKQFDPKAVKQHSKPLGNFKGITPCIYDVKNNEIIWCDTPDYVISACGNSGSKNVVKSTDYIMDRYATMDRITQGEMIRLVATAQGCEIVDSPDKADTLFMMEEYDKKTNNQRVITSKDLDVWIGEFMTPYVEDENYAEELSKDTPTAISNEDEINSLMDVLENQPSLFNGNLSEKIEEYNDIQKITFDNNEIEVEEDYDLDEEEL